MSSDDFPADGLHRIRQSAQRGRHDRSTVYAILDAAWVAHVAILEGGRPLVIPMFHVRQGDCLLFHGSAKSRLMQYLASGREVSLSVALVDGLVLARSIFHHSMNYRSVVVTGSGRPVEDPEERRSAIAAIAERVAPGRSLEARWPSGQEDKATLIVGMDLTAASAKVRTGGPRDDPQDLGLDVWAGVLPLRVQMGEPKPDAGCGPAPEALMAWQRAFNRGN